MEAWLRRQVIRSPAISRSKCLATLRLLMIFPACKPILSGSLIRPAVDPGGDLAQVVLGGPQQVLALTGALASQDRVAAGDQPLAWVVRAGDLGQVLLVQQAELEGPVIGH